MATQRITVAGSTIVKEGAGRLLTVTVNTPALDAVIGFDGIPEYAWIWLTETLVAKSPYSAVYDLAFADGLTVFTSDAGLDITVEFE